MNERWIVGTHFFRSDPILLRTLATMENPQAFTRNTPNNATLVTLERGKIPPQAIDFRGGCVGSNAY